MEFMKLSNVAPKGAELLPQPRATIVHKPTQFPENEARAIDQRSNQNKSDQLNSDQNSMYTGGTVGNVKMDKKRIQ